MVQDWPPVLSSRMLGVLRVEVTNAEVCLVVGHVDRLCRFDGWFIYGC